MCLARQSPKPLRRPAADTIDEMLTNIRIGHGDYIIDPCSGSFGFQARAHGTHGAA